MADEHGRTGKGPQELGQVGGVASEIAKRVAEPDGGVPAVLQGTDFGVEAGRVGPGTVRTGAIVGDPVAILITLQC